MTLSREELEAMLADDAMGLLEEDRKAAPTTSDDRLVAQFDEIQDFVDRHGRLPAKTTDVGERRLATRLERLCSDEALVEQLAPSDRHGLLVPPVAPETIEEALASDDLGLLDDDDELGLLDTSTLPQIRSVPDEIGSREPCENFDEYRTLFEECHHDLRVGRRSLIPFRNPSNIEQGKFFVQNGQLVYVNHVGDLVKTQPGTDGRIHCIWENGTEARILLRSLARSLYDNGRIVTEGSEIIGERLGLADDDVLGTVYVLKSLSEDPSIQEIPNLHKIGSTKQTIEQRIAGAEDDPTFLRAPVWPVKGYKIPVAAITKVESLLHRFFASARVDAVYELPHKNVDVTEWFDVPIEEIDKAITLLENDTISNYRYDRERRQIVLV